MKFVLMIIQLPMLATATATELEYQVLKIDVPVGSIMLLFLMLTVEV